MMPIYVRAQHGHGSADLIAVARGILVQSPLHAL